MTDVRLPNEGPFVAVAALCENVIEDRYGVLSLIRVIDTVTIQLQGANVPEALPAGQWAAKLVVSLKAGNAQGRHAVTIVPELPSGERLDPLFQAPVHFESGFRGTNLVLDLQYELQQEGTHWFDVLLDDQQRLSRVPLHVVYQPLRTSGGA